MDVNIAASAVDVMLGTDFTAVFGSALQTYDYDTGAGTDTVVALGLVFPASGGAVAAPGDGTNGMLVNLGSNNDVTVTSISAGDNNIGNVDIASIAAGDNNIGNVDVLTVITGTGATNLGKAEDGAHSSGDTGVYVLGVRDDSPAVHSGTDNDYESLHINNQGGLWVSPMPPTFETALDSKIMKKYYTNAGAVTDGIVWSPAAGTRWHVMSMYVNVSAAATVTFEDDLSGGDSAVLKGEYAANSGFTVHFNPPLASGEDAADLLVTTSAGNIYVTVTGYEV